MLKPYETGLDERTVEEALQANIAMRYLLSDEPAPGITGMETFGQFVGSWDLTMAAIGADGSWTELVAEWHFGWALHGRAVQDVLITRQHDGALVGYGTTVRTYDDRDGKWWIVWQDPIAHEFAVLFARHEGDEIVLEGQWPTSSDRRFRWVFSAITPASFNWEAQISSDGGTSWEVGEVIDARRRRRSPSPLQTPMPDRVVS
jgi:hypothetical protein